MPDRNSLAFWKDCAGAYKDHPAVLFDLYNEPHNVTWDVWLERGQGDGEGPPRRGYTKTYDAVGDAGAPGRRACDGREERRHRGRAGLVVRHRRAFLDGKQLSDPEGQRGDLRQPRLSVQGRQRGAVDREDGGRDEEAAGDRQRVRERPAKGGAGLTGEQWVREVLQALDDHGWDWTAWDLHPAAGPTLVSDWNYTPTPSFGAFVKQELAGALPPYTPPASP